MKIIAYPCILISLLACCNLFEPKKSTSTCPDIDALWLRADSFYTAHGKLAVDTLNDSFAPLSVGNTWEYEYTVVQATAGIGCRHKSNPHDYLRKYFHSG